jgi:hypothetical protein
VKQKDELEDNTTCINNINGTDEDEIYEKVDVDEDPDLIETRMEKREFFERARCRFGKT